MLTRSARPCQGAGRRPPAPRPPPRPSPPPQPALPQRARAKQPLGGPGWPGRPRLPTLTRRSAGCQTTPPCGSP
eukprot:13872994-Alexandrium_andersonii.AAC.1